MTNTQLSAGAIAVLKTKNSPPGFKPVLQVLSIATTSASGVERYKLQLSDGSAFMNGILATQLNETIKRNDLKVNSIIRLEEHIVNDMASALFVVVLKFEILESPPMKIGNPVDSSGPQAAQQQPTTTSNRVYAPPTVQTRPAPNFQMDAPAPAYQQPQQQQQPYQQYQAPQAGQGYQQQRPAQTYAAATPQAGAGARAPVAPLQSMVGGAGGARATQRFLPIKMVNPYQNKWVIRARVTSKGEIKTWDKGPTNSGKLFSVDLVDHDGGEIRATFFREAVDLFYDVLQVGNVYTFSEGKVKIANRQFSAIKNEYEINFGKEAQIQPVQDEGDIVRIHLQPISINDITTLEPKQTVDVIGVATEVGEVASLVSKAGKELRKLDFTLVDRSNASVKVTVWNQKADEVANELRSLPTPNPVIAVRGAQVGDYGGRSLSTISSSSILINPLELPIAGTLRTWYDQGGGRTVTSLTAGREGGERGPAPMRDRLTLETIKLQGLGKNGQQDYIDVKAFISHIFNEGLSYPACLTEKCNKKVTLASDRWYCEKCNVYFDEPAYRYIARLQLADATGATYATAFADVGNHIFGMSASDLEKIKKSDPAQFEQVITKSCFREGVFRLKVKEEMYQDQATTKSSILSFKPLDYAAESKELAKAIEQYEGLAQ